MGLLLFVSISLNSNICITSHSKYQKHWSGIQQYYLRNQHALNGSEIKYCGYICHIILFDKFLSRVECRHIGIYYINNYRNWGRIWIGCWNHKRHSRARRNGRAMGCLLWIFLRKLTTLVHIERKTSIFDRGLFNICVMTHSKQTYVTAKVIILIFKLNKI